MLITLPRDSPLDIYSAKPHYKTNYGRVRGIKEAIQGVKRRSRWAAITRRRVFLSFLISYALVLLPFYTIWSVTNNQALGAAKAEIAERARQQLIGGARQLDARVMELTDMIDRIALDPATDAFLSSGSLDPASRDFFQVYAYQKALSVYKAQNQFVDGLYVFSQGSEVLITHDYATTQFSFINGNGFSYDELSLPKLYEFLWSRRFNRTPVLCQRFSDYAEPGPTVCLLTSLPYISNRQNRTSVLMATISTESIRSLFSFVEGENGRLYLLNSEGLALPITAGEVMDNNLQALLDAGERARGTLINAVETRLTGWRCVLVQDENELMSDLLALRSRFTIILAASLAAGIALSTILAYWNTNRMRRVVSNVRRAFSGKHGGTRGDKAQIDAILARLMARADSERDDFELPGQWQYIPRLMRGELFEDSEEMRLMHALGMYEPDNFFVAVLMQIDEIYYVSEGYSSRERSALNQALLEYLKQCFDHLDVMVGFCEMSPGEIGVLMSAEREGALIEALTDRFPSIAGDMDKHIPLRCRASIGGIYRAISSVPRSYEDARAALAASSFAHDKQTIFWPRAETFLDAYAYPMAVETRLLNQVRSGKEAQARETMRAILEENTVRRKLSPEMARQLVYALTNTVRRAMAEQGMDASVFESQTLIGDARSLADMFSAIENALTALCRRIGAEDDARARELMNDVVRFIQENYSNPDITLAYAAERNGLTEWQLYRLMKTQLGISFADYLEALRIDRACELLVSGARPSEVASSVGYMNDTTFRRAFKRVKGDTPSGYAKAAQPE